jgi:hypothetical protein
MAYSSALMNLDGKQFDNGISTVSESSKLTNEVYERYDQIKSIYKTDGYYNKSFIDSETTNVPDRKNYQNNNDNYEDEYYSYYAYPSSYLDSGYAYRSYKVTVLKSIFNVAQFNPKGTFEGEWTRYNDDCDFSALTGYHKDTFLCDGDLSSYIVSIE